MASFRLSDQQSALEINKLGKADLAQHPTSLVNIPEMDTDAAFLRCLLTQIRRCVLLLTAPIPMSRGYDPS